MNKEKRLIMKGENFNDENKSKVNYKKGFLNLKFTISVILILGFILLTAVFISAYTRSAPAYTFGHQTTSFLGGQQPLYDREMCGAGQDFILQIDPLGCVNAPVRSDLLEEQPVSVLCPVYATQLNPMIKIENINHMTISSRDLPKEVLTVGYYPARAALGRYFGNEITRPVFDNVGYATIVLRQQPNESAMPDFVEGNLTANIRYDINNAFGTGRTVYYLPQITDEEFNRDYRAYAFWDGRGYLKLEGSDENRATIGVYSDYDVSRAERQGEKSRIASLDLEKGKTGKVFMPGFNYCLGGMNVKLEGLENPDTRARIRVDSDVLELKKGDKFLENACTVKEIRKQGINQYVEISCREDTGNKKFTLGINPKVNLSIGNLPGRESSVGDYLFSTDEHHVYLGFIGSNGTTNSAGELYIRVIGIPIIKRAESQKDKLTQSEISYIAEYDRATGKSDLALGTEEKVAAFLRSFGSKLGALARQFFNGKNLDYTTYSTPNKEVFGKQIRINGYVGAHNAEIELLPAETKSNYQSAVEDFEIIKDSFASERWPENNDLTLGEDALKDSIKLADNMRQRRTAVELCMEFSEVYPNSPMPDICGSEYLQANTNISGQSVFVNGRTHIISFEGAREPDFYEFGLEIRITYPNGGFNETTLTKEDYFYLNRTANEYIQLVGLEDDSATLRVIAERSLTTTKDRLTSQKLEIGKEENFGTKYHFSIQKINLKKVARVSLNPEIDYAKTNATFNFKIGIEKRGIQLSPEKTTEKILGLNGTIQKLEKISNNLGKIVSTGKKACLYTSLGLTAKNFIANLGGKGIARQKVMRSDNGWYDQCQKRVNNNEYGDVEQCLLDNSDEIEASVNVVNEQLNSQNQQMKQLEQGISRTSFLGETVVNTDALTERLLADSGFKEDISSCTINRQVTVGGRTVDTESIVLDAETTSLTQARDLQLYCRLINSGDSVTNELAAKQVNKIFGEIYSNSEPEREGFAGAFGRASALYSSNKKATEIPVTEARPWKEVMNEFDSAGTTDIGANDLTFKIKDTATAKQYLLVLDNDYVITRTYNITGRVLTRIGTDDMPNPLGLTVKYYDAGAYENEYENPIARYYETDPYRGLPAVVPFDLQNGWYAAVKSTLPVLGNLRAYDSSGRVSSFYVCNVGGNKKEEFIGGDDICRGFYPRSGAAPNFPGLTETQSLALMQRAEKAIEVATEQREKNPSGLSDITIYNQRIHVGSPAADIPDIQCEDFMSPTDCNIMFNVCDPFICPSSRCDLGGAYPVKDVVQSGIIGSLALCAPNFPEVKVPICVSGVHAGVEGWTSVFRSYEQCLQTSLDTGSTVGICDEINSVYMCEFIWRQGLPVAKYAAPKILSGILGQNTRGGGEYLTTQNAIDNVGKSFEYFTQYYADDSYRAFKARSAESVGSELCRNYVSFTGPEGGNLLDAFTAPDSPPQFYGRFEEILEQTVTNPPSSHYKVFYHIYAGKDFPSYFQVYLRGTGSSYYQGTEFARPVASGVIPTGDFKTETIDFTAPSGYQELCIVVNGQEECGFKEVTTDFFINTITEEYVAREASRTDIDSEAECVSGSPDSFSFLNPISAGQISSGILPQSGAEEFLNPAIYNRGIIRVCATDDPGKGTDSSAGESRRWKLVGTCGNENLGCWLDESSVKDTIRNTATEERVLGETRANYLDALQKEGIFINSTEFASLEKEIKELRSSGNNAGIIKKINEKIDKVFYNNQKGYLYLVRGMSYSNIAITAYNVYLNSLKANDAGSPPKTGVDPSDEIISGLPPLDRPLLNVNYPIFEFTPGGIHYTYSGNGWFWCTKNCGDDKNWYEAGLAEFSGTSSGGDITSMQLIPALSDKNKQFILSLVDRTYLAGLASLMTRITQNNEGGVLPCWIGGCTKLSTENVDYSKEGRFSVKREVKMKNLATSEFYQRVVEIIFFEFRDGNWFWSIDERNWVPITKSTTRSASFDVTIIDDSFIDFLKSLEETSLNRYTGAAIIFGIDAQSDSVSGVGDTGTETIPTSCTTDSECRTVLGLQIIELAKAKKETAAQEQSLSIYAFDSRVKEDTGAKNFECLVLQVARVESSIQHCQDVEEDGNPLYCNGDDSQIIGGDATESGDAVSKGIMQINTGVHKNVDVANFETNVNYALDLLINNYNSGSRTFRCHPQADNNFVSIGYTGWNVSLRNYNGWSNPDGNPPCTKGNILYVENVTSMKGEIASLFREQCGE